MPVPLAVGLSKSKSYIVLFYRQQVRYTVQGDPSSVNLAMSL